MLKKSIKKMYGKKAGAGTVASVTASACHAAMAG